MAHQDDCTVFETVMELLTEAGFDQFAEAFRLLVTQSMLAQRAEAIGAGPYERTEARAGYANGFKPKTVATRMGKIQLAVPQVRGPVSFYPSALERGVRSERYTYAEMEGMPWVLFDNREDPFQTANLIRDPERAELRRRLRAEMERWMVEAGDTLSEAELDAFRAEQRKRYR